MMTLFYRSKYFIFPTRLSEEQRMCLASENVFLTNTLNHLSVVLGDRVDNHKSTSVIMVIVQQNVHYKCMVINMYIRHASN